MTDNATPEVTLRFEMGCTLADFHRLLPGVAAVRYDGTLRQFTHEEESRGWSVRLGEPRERSIASVRLPVLDVTFVFHGYRQPEIDAITERFFAHFRRGGG